MRLLAATLAILLPTMALAQDTVPDVGEILTVTIGGMCAERGAAYIDDRRVRYGEQVLFLSDGQSYIIDGEEVLDRPGILAVLSNQDTGTVSVLMLYPDGVACELITGINFEPQ